MNKIKEIFNFISFSVYFLIHTEDIYRLSFWRIKK